MALQLEQVTAAYGASLTQSAIGAQYPRGPGTACCWRTLCGAVPHNSTILVVLVDVQNMLLQALWQPELSTACKAGLGLDKWVRYKRRPHQYPNLALWRMSSQMLSTHVGRLRHTMLAMPQQGAPWPFFIDTFVCSPLIKAFCDADILRRSVWPE